MKVLAHHVVSAKEEMSMVVVGEVAAFANPPAEEKDQHHNGNLVLFHGFPLEFICLSSCRQIQSYALGLGSQLWSGGGNRYRR